MSGKHKFLKDASHAFAGLVLSLLMGIVGGGICGTVILGFGGLIGRSGTTGTEYFGYWSADFIWLGVVYGGIFGAFVGPIAYPFLVRKIKIHPARVSRDNCWRIRWSGCRAPCCGPDGNLRILSCARLGTNQIG